MERKIKSYGFRATMEFIEEKYDAAAKGRIFAAVSPQTREFFDHAKKATHHDPVYSSELWSAMVKEHPGNDEAFAQLVKTGRHMGDYATSTYLKLIMRILTVRMFTRK